MKRKKMTIHEMQTACDSWIEEMQKAGLQPLCMIAYDPDDNTRIRMANPRTEEDDITMQEEDRYMISVLVGMAAAIQEKKHVQTIMFVPVNSKKKSDGKSDGN